MPVHRQYCTLVGFYTINAAIVRCPEKVQHSIRDIVLNFHDGLLNDFVKGCIFEGAGQLFALQVRNLMPKKIVQEPPQHDPAYAIVYPSGLIDVMSVRKEPEMIRIYAKTRGLVENKDFRIAPVKVTINE